MDMKKNTKKQLMKSVVPVVDVHSGEDALKNNPEGYQLGKHLSQALPDWSEHCAEVIQAKKLDEFNADFFDAGIDAITNEDNAELGKERALHKLAVIPSFNTARLRALWKTSKTYTFLEEKYESAIGECVRAREDVENNGILIKQLTQETSKLNFDSHYRFMVGFLIVTTIIDAISSFSFFQMVLYDHKIMIYLMTGMLALLSNPPTTIFVGYLKEENRTKTHTAFMWSSLVVSLAFSLIIFIARLSSTEMYFNPAGMYFEGTSNASLSVGQWMVSALLGVTPLLTMILNIVVGYHKDDRTEELIKARRRQKRLTRELELKTQARDFWRKSMDDVAVLVAAIEEDIQTRDFEALDEALYQNTLLINESINRLLKAKAREEFSSDAASATYLTQHFVA